MRPGGEVVTFQNRQFSPIFPSIHTNNVWSSPIFIVVRKIFRLIHWKLFAYFTFAGMFIPWNCNRPSILRFQSGRKFTFTHLKNKNTNKNISEIRTFTDFYGPRSEIRTNTDQYGLVRILRTSWPPWTPSISFPTNSSNLERVQLKLQEEFFIPYHNRGGST